MKFKFDIDGIFIDLWLFLNLKFKCLGRAMSIYKKRECTNSKYYSAFGLFNPDYSFFFFIVHQFVCAFLSFLLNIYKCMYSYIELTKSYNIFTIIDNLHGSSAFFFFHSKPVLLVLFLSFLLNIICAYTVTLTQQFFTIF